MHVNLFFAQGTKNALEVKLNPLIRILNVSRAGHFCEFVMNP